MQGSLISKTPTHISEHLKILLHMKFYNFFFKWYKYFKSIVTMIIDVIMNKFSKANYQQSEIIHLDDANTLGSNSVLERMFNIYFKLKV